MEMYRQELLGTYARYEQIESGFIGSYVEKEDRSMFN
jgi:hypothetical protein